jgi:hypothetical protein
MKCLYKYSVQYYCIYALVAEKGRECGRGGWMEMDGWLEFSEHAALDLRRK